MGYRYIDPARKSNRSVRWTLFFYNRRSTNSCTISAPRWASMESNVRSSIAFKFCDWFTYHHSRLYQHYILNDDHEVSLSRSVIMDLGERWRACRFRSNRHSTTGLWNRRQIEQRTPAHAAETPSSHKRSDANTRSPDGICARAFQSD